MVEISETSACFAEPQPLLEPILRNAVRALGGSAGVVANWDEVTRRFTVSAAYGIDDRELSRLRPLLDEALPDLAGSREQYDLLSEINPSGILPVSEHGELQDPVLALPLSTGGHTIGLIYVLRSSESATFSRLDPPVLAAFAEQAAIAVQHARLVHLLAQEKQRAEAILEGSADGIYTVDANRRIVGLNSAMERILGRSKEEVIGQQCAVALGLRDWNGRLVCPWRCPMLMQADRATHTVEVQGRIQSRDRRKYTDVALVYSIVRSPDGVPLNAVVNVRDISRTREMENLRSVFLSMLGHELQTPLSIIKGYANTLARSDGRWDKATLRQSFGVIEEESDRLSHLVNRLLLASRVESGALTLQREPVQLALLAPKVVRRFQAMTTRHTFSIDFSPDFPAVSADAALIEEVLINLLDNAVKYSPEGGNIRVEGCAADQQVSVSVVDQGVGIAYWEAARIFEQFRRGDDPVTKRTRGLGLGLYICHSIVAVHGGRIDLNSQPGKGSRFTVVLPVEPDTITR